MCSLDHSTDGLLNFGFCSGGRIDPSTVFGAILVGEQALLNLQYMYGILVEF